MAEKRDHKKTTNENPVSLHPIPFDEALRDLLSVKPPIKNDEKNTKDKKRKKKSR